MHHKITGTLEPVYRSTTKMVSSRFRALRDLYIKDFVFSKFYNHYIKQTINMNCKFYCIQQYSISYSMKNDFITCPHSHY